MTGASPRVYAATFRAWFELLDDVVAHDPDEIAPGNRQPALLLLHDLVGIGLRAGAIRAVVIHSSGPGSFAHLMFRYSLDPEFDWNGEIDLGPEPPVADLARATGISEHAPLA